MLAGGEGAVGSGQPREPGCQLWCRPRVCPFLSVILGKLLGLICRRKITYFLPRKAMGVGTPSPVRKSPMNSLELWHAAALAILLK